MPVFSQTSLQDFVDCERRFQLRHILHLAWPAPQAEPMLENEAHLRQGAAFHRLLHQHYLGIPRERLERLHMPDPLRRWWRAHRATVPPLLGEDAHLYPEILLAAAFQGQRLIARYDLLAVYPGKRVLILDWKTNRRRPRRAWMQARLQTRLYPFLVALTGAFLNRGVPWQPEQIEMVYWFAEAPAEPMRFPYSRAGLQNDRAFFRTLLARLDSLPEDAPLPRTDDERACRFCVYRSLCERGAQAGPLEETFQEQPDFAEAPAWQIDFDAIEPLPF